MSDHGPRKDAIARFVRPYVEHAERVVVRSVEDAAHRVRTSPAQGKPFRDALTVARKRLDAIPDALLRSSGATARIAWTGILGDSWRFHRVQLGEFARPEPNIPPELADWAISAIRINGVHPLQGLEAELASQHQRLRAAGAGERASRGRAVDAWEAAASQQLQSLASTIFFTGAFRADTLAAQLAVIDGAREPDPTMAVAGRG